MAPWNSLSKVLIDVMKKHGSNTENISHAVLRLGTKLWWLRAPLTFLHATSGNEPHTPLPESSALHTRPPRQPLKFETMLGRRVRPPWVALKGLKLDFRGL